MMGKYRQAGEVNRLIWLLTVALIVSMYVFTNETYGTYILLALTVVIFFIYAIQNGFKITLSIDRMHWHIIAFIIFCFFSAALAWSPSAAVTKGITITEILVCVIVLYMAYQNVEDLWCLANAIKWAGFIVALYSFYYYGLDTIRNVLNNSRRLENDYANVNAIATICAVCVIIVLYELFFRRINPISIIISIPCIFLIAATGSRKGFIMLVMGLALTLIFRFANRNVLRTILVIIIVVAAIYLLYRIMLSLGLFSGVMRRIQSMLAILTGNGTVDNSAQERVRFIRIGWNQFKQTPIFGIGIGSSGELLVENGERNTYLHNNFVELLACGGIVGFAIYYSMFYDCIRNFIRFRLRDPMSKLCMILILINLTMDYASVTYYSKMTYIYFLLFFLMIRKMQRETSSEVVYEYVKDG